MGACSKFHVLILGKTPELPLLASPLTVIFVVVVCFCLTAIAASNVATVLATTTVACDHYGFYIFPYSKMTSIAPTQLASL
jgi:hypothetical protein